MTVVEAPARKGRVQWIGQKCWFAVVHTYVLCGALVGLGTGVVRAAAGLKFDKESLITFYKVVLPC